MTNAERIRQMTDEELAEMLDNAVHDCEYCQLYETCLLYPYESCKSMLLKWLKEEAEE